MKNGGKLSPYSNIESGMVPTRSSYVEKNTDKSAEELKIRRDQYVKPAFTMAGADVYKFNNAYSTHHPETGEIVRSTNLDTIRRNLGLLPSHTYKPPEFRHYERGVESGQNYNYTLRSLWLKYLYGIESPLKMDYATGKVWGTGFNFDGDPFKIKKNEAMAAWDFFHNIYYGKDTNYIAKHMENEIKHKLKQSPLGDPSVTTGKNIESIENLRKQYPHIDILKHPAMSNLIGGRKITSFDTFGRIRPLSETDKPKNLLKTANTHNAFMKQEREYELLRQELETWALFDKYWGKTAEYQNQIPETQRWAEWLARSPVIQHQPEWLGGWFGENLKGFATGGLLRRNRNTSSCSIGGPGYGRGAGSRFANGGRIKEWSTKYPDLYKLAMSNMSPEVLDYLFDNQGFSLNDVKIGKYTFPQDWHISDISSYLKNPQEFHFENLKTRKNRYSLYPSDVNKAVFRELSVGDAKLTKAGNKGWFMTNTENMLEGLPSNFSLRGIAQGKELISSADIVISIGGGSGTLGEMVIAYQQKIPIYSFENSGGISKMYCNKFIDSRKHDIIHSLKSINDFKKLL